MAQHGIYTERAAMDTLTDLLDAFAILATVAVKLAEGRPLTDAEIQAVDTLRNQCEYEARCGKPDPDQLDLREFLLLRSQHEPVSA